MKPSKAIVKQTAADCIVVFNRLLWLRAKRDAIDAEIEKLSVVTRKDRAARRKKGLSF